MDQLKREEALERRPISESYSQLISYILDNQNDDYLVVLDKTKDNPYQEKSKFPCKLLWWKRGRQVCFILTRSRKLIENQFLVHKFRCPKFLQKWINNLLKAEILDILISYFDLVKLVLSNSLYLVGRFTRSIRSSVCFRPSRLLSIYFRSPFGLFLVNFRPLLFKPCCHPCPILQF